MSDKKIGNLKGAIEHIKALYKSENYSSSFSFKLVTRILGVILVIWFIGNLLFISAIYKFVNERVSGLQSEVSSNISKGSESLGYLDHSLRGYRNDEQKVMKEFAEEAKKKERESKNQAEKKEIAQTIENMSKHSYEDFINYRAPGAIFLIEKLKSCRGDLNDWLPHRRGLVNVKLKVVKQYKEELANKKNWDRGEKRAKQDYIKMFGHLESDTSKETLFKQLMTKTAKEIEIENSTVGSSGDYEEGIEKLQVCLSYADNTTRSIYNYWYDYPQKIVDFSKWNFHELKSLAEFFEIKDLDFTVIDIITEEAARLGSLQRFYGDNPFYDMKEVINDGSYYKHLITVMQIFEETNRKLAEVDPENMGFKTNAYKYRMKMYEEWKAKWDEEMSGKQKASSVSKVS